MNASYDLSIHEGPMQFRDGEYTDESGVVPFTAWIRPELTTFLDLNRDGRTDALVVVGWSGGGSGTFTQLFPVIGAPGAAIPGRPTSLGDRVNVRALSTNTTGVVVDLVVHGPFDPRCCPTLHTLQRLT
jgi:hypothetical protein